MPIYSRMVIDLLSIWIIIIIFVSLSNYFQLSTDRLIQRKVTFIKMALICQYKRFELNQSSSKKTSI